MQPRLRVEHGYKMGKLVACAELREVDLCFRQPSPCSSRVRRLSLREIDLHVRALLRFLTGRIRYLHSNQASHGHTVDNRCANDVACGFASNHCARFFHFHSSGI